MSENAVKWFKREGPTWTIDVKVERYPGHAWTWPRIVAISAALLGIAQELLTEHIEGVTQPEGTDDG
jgi:hypothetical protein